MGPPNERVIWIFLSFDRYEKHKDSKKGGAQICTSYVLYFVCVWESNTLKRFILAKLGDEKGRPKVKPHCAHDSFGVWNIHSTSGHLHGNCW